MADQQVIHLDDNGNVIVPSPPKVTEPGNDVLHLDDSGNTIGKNGALFEHKPDLQIKGEHSYDPRIVAPNVLAAAGGTAGSLLGGPVGGIAGAGLGSAAGEFLKHEDPTHYSQDGTAPTMEDSALNVGLNAAGEGANQAVTGIVQKWVQGGIKRPVAEFLASKMGSAVPAVKNAINNDKVASGLTELPLKKPGQNIDEPKAISTILGKGAKNGRINNSEAITSEMEKPEYRGIVSEETKKNINDLIETASSTTDPNTPKGSLYMSKAGLVLGSAALNHEAGMAAGGLILGNELLGHIAANPQIMSLMKEVKDLPPDSAKAKLLKQAVLFAARGTTQYMVSPSGEKEQVVISKDGVPQLPR